MNASTPGSPADSLFEARENLAEVHRLLVQPTPQSLMLACRTLSRARENIEAVNVLLNNHPDRDQGLLALVRPLRQEIRMVRILLERAGQFHADLLRKMTAASYEEASPAACVTRAQGRLHWRG